MGRREGGGGGAVAIGGDQLGDLALAEALAQASRRLRARSRGARRAPAEQETCQPCADLIVRRGRGEPCDVLRHGKGVVKDV